MWCQESLRLFDAYADALASFHDAKAAPEAGLAKVAAHKKKDLAYANLVKAHGLYWKHVQMHGCRVTERATGGPPQEPREVHRLAAVSEHIPD